MTDEISTPRLRRARHELWRRQCRNGNDAGACRQGQGGGSERAHREIDRMLQAGRCQGPARQRAAEIPLRVQKKLELIARAARSAPPLPVGGEGWGEEGSPLIVRSPSPGSLRDPTSPYGRGGQSSRPEPILKFEIGDPGGIRTPNPRSRNPMLYPVELRGRTQMVTRIAARAQVLPAGPLTPTL